jgi:hypothetical protein
MLHLKLDTVKKSTKNKTFKIPSVNENSASIQIEERNKKVEERMKQQKEKVKTYVDKTREVKETNLKVGDTVLARQSKKNKFSTSYEPQPYKVVSIKGSSVTARRGDKYITRHTSFMKKFSGTAKGKDDEGTTTDDVSEEDNHQENHDVQEPELDRISS